MAPLLSSFPCDECPFIKHCCTTFSQRCGMIMICAFSDYYQGDTLEVFKRGDLKVMKTMRALNVDSLKIHHPFLLHLYIKVLNES